MLKSAIKYKVNEAGGQYIEIPTKQVAPSQTCPNCGHKQKKERLDRARRGLSERVHSCHCGYTADRDVAAAQVMLNWVLYGSGVFGTSIVKRGCSSGSTARLSSPKSLLIPPSIAEG